MSGQQFRLLGCELLLGQYALVPRTGEPVYLVGDAGGGARRGLDVAAGGLVHGGHVAGVPPAGRSLRSTFPMSREPERGRLPSWPASRSNGSAGMPCRQRFRPARSTWCRCSTRRCPRPLARPPCRRCSTRCAHGPAVTHDGSVDTAEPDRCTTRLGAATPCAEHNDRDRSELLTLGERRRSHLTRPQHQ